LAARIRRLEWLVRFLKSMPPGKVQVAFNPNLPDQRSLTIVGNWFAAESVSAAIGQGYRHTIFTRHAPSVQSISELFDEEFTEALKANKWKARESRNRAIRELQSLIAELEIERKRREKRMKAKNQRRKKPKA
jgi:predicted metalloendopeptidase